MVPHEIETYVTHDEAGQLSVHRDEDGFAIAYWLTSGIASIAYEPQVFMDLLEMLAAYKEEEIDAPKTPNYIKIGATIFLMTLVSTLLFILLSS